MANPSASASLWVSQGWKSPARNTATIETTIPQNSPSTVL